MISRQTIPFVTGVLLALLRFYAVSTLTCYSCENDGNSTACQNDFQHTDNTEECQGDGDQCFVLLEESNGEQISFQRGCAGPMYCSYGSGCMDNFFQGSKVCGYCCDDDLCNTGYSDDEDSMAGQFSHH
ncbi:U-scoloptoxin(05)-Cw1a-like [Ptychodera flava]|uniref:U-scoloptoxin(05)-Cw1a-like n=1 Tax=Ptychodera flava TaxID=63121 RepID=UPI00396A984A